MSRPELIAPPEIYYGDTEAKKYTANTRIQQIQSDMTHRTLELLTLPPDEPKFILDIGCGSGLSGEILDEEGHYWVGVDIAPSMLEVALEREVEGDLFLQDIGQGFGFRPEQFYPTSDDQIHLITSIAQRAGFGGGVVVDYPNSKKAKKVFLCLFVGSGGAQQELGEETVAYERRRDKERRREKSGKRKSVKAKDWILNKKELYRQRGKESVPSDSKFTGRKRRPVF
ncbi:williams-Beuren syndrome critical region protein 22 [Phellopilus nigrolimitatus]|nr:williams-Beuren syndrome critical region protein 22 [Phellopilus nigrolimitatus]